MDHQEQKAQRKSQERKEGHRHEISTERTREQQVAQGTRTIRPLWFAGLGFVLAMVAVLRWMGLF